MILLLDRCTCLLRRPISLELFRLRYFEWAPSAFGDMPLCLIDLSDIMGDGDRDKNRVILTPLSAYERILIGNLYEQYVS